MSKSIWSLILFTAASAFIGRSSAAEPFELLEGDRVVFVGNTFFEREMDECLIETTLTLIRSDRNVTFRNLGWSGDNVFAAARAGFGTPEDGFKNLEAQITDLKPTVIFVAYGMSESFEGTAGLDSFQNGLNRMLDMLAKSGARMVLLSPIRHENLGAPLPDPTAHNGQLELYVDALRKTADERKYRFINLYEQLRSASAPLTDNGIHLTPGGYEAAAAVIARELGHEPPTDLRSKKGDTLRKAIIEKNRHYFNRWRPQNDTYIFGFRKKEQGQNAVEIPQFDPLVEAKEKEIAKLRQGLEVEPSTRRKPEIITAEDKAPDPEIERQSFQVAEGFEVSLFAAEPLIGKPIQINFDPEGRLWIASSAIYPQIKPGEAAEDKILVIEDRDHDGRADTSHVFADGLLIPTGVEPGDGGAYVANSTELIHLKDTDGDGKADQRRVLLSGFGTEDTHHILHTFRWGPDGILNFNQSIYIHSHIETPWGTRRLGGGGFWRYRPKSDELEVFARGLVNPWGHVFDRWGQSFATDGAGGEGINYVIPGATFAAFPQAPRRRLPGLNPGSPKYCSVEVIGGRHFPEDWQGDMITNDFRANRVVRFKLTESGSGYSSKLMTDVIKTKDVAFRPVDVRMGPDGALYIADWYNPIINHGEVDFRDPRRDHIHGRIWRVTAKGRPLVDQPKLGRMTAAQLVDQLKSPEDWTRQQARRRLAESDPKDVLSATAQWLKHLDPSDPEVEHHRLEALWVYETLDTVNLDLLRQLLDSKEARARAAAVRTLSHWRTRVENPMDFLKTRVTDEHPRVRLEAVRALDQIGTVEAMQVAMRALDKPVDSFLDYGLWVTANNLQPIWEPAFQTGQLGFDRFGHAEYALQAVRSSQAAKYLIAQLEAGKVSPQDRDRVLGLISESAAAEDMPPLLKLAAESSSDAKLQTGLLRSLVRLARDRKIEFDADSSAITSLLASPDPMVAEQAIALAGILKREEFRKTLSSIASKKESDGKLSPPRQAALVALANLGGEKSVKKLAAISRKDDSIEARLAATIGLVSLDMQRAGKLAARLLNSKEWKSSPNYEEASALFGAFLNRKGGAEALGSALEPAKLNPDMAKLGLRAVYAAGRQDEALVKVLSIAAGLSGEPRPITPEEVQSLMTEVQAKGDATRGEHIFRSKEVSCFKCHAIAGAGGQLGPDLSSIGASAPLDYLIESVLIPNKAIKENFAATEISTKEGDYYSGIKLRESDEEVAIKDAAHDEILISKATIEETRAIGSLMPAGLADMLTQGEFLDLVRFLSELGRPGDFAVPNAQAVRRWRVLDPAEGKFAAVDARELGGMIAQSEDVKASDWMPAYSQVSGMLPIEALIPLRGSDMAVIQCEIDVTDPGRILLRPNSIKGLILWNGAHVVAVEEDKGAGPAYGMDLQRGLHTFTLTVDLRQREGEGLRLLLDDSAESGGKVRFVAGR